VLIFLILGWQFSAAQEQDSLSYSDSLSNSAPEEITSLDSMRTFMEDVNNESVSDAAKSATTAIVLSLLIPGSGQIYYEDYWKAPIFFGGAVVLGWWAWKNNETYKDLEAQGDPNKEIYRNNRDQSLFFLAGVYILAAVDAYVGVHLYNFNVNENLSLYLAPDENTGNIKIAVNLRL
jgi:TM2 domain-containing membrane protein YozV